MDLTGLSKDEMRELKLALNELVARRQIYKFNETKEKLLKDNEKYLELDYELLKRIIKMMEE